MLIKITFQELFQFGSWRTMKTASRALISTPFKNLFPIALTYFVLELPSLPHHMPFVKAGSFPFVL